LDFSSLLLKLEEWMKEKYPSNFYFNKLTDDIYTLHYEKYFFRTNSNLLMSILIKMVDEDTVEFEVTSGGGKTGMIGEDMDAEASSIKKFVKEIAHILEDNNWSFDQVNEEYLKESFFSKLFHPKKNKKQ
jgi:hypothetical protein